MVAKAFAMALAADKEQPDDRGTSDMPSLISQVQKNRRDPLTWHPFTPLDLDLGPYQGIAPAETEAQLAELEKGVAEYYHGYRCALRGGLVHRELWKHFHGEIPPGWDVHHIDCNKLNNKITNLIALPHSWHMELHAAMKNGKRFDWERCAELHNLAIVKVNAILEPMERIDAQVAKLQREISLLRANKSSDNALRLLKKLANEGVADKRFINKRTIKDFGELGSCSYRRKGKTVRFQEPHPWDVQDPFAAATLPEAS